MTSNKESEILVQNVVLHQPAYLHISQSNNKAYQVPMLIRVQSVRPCLYSVPHTLRHQKRPRPSQAPVPRRRWIQLASTNRSSPTAQALVHLLRLPLVFSPVTSDHQLRLLVQVCPTNWTDKKSPSSNNYALLPVPPSVLSRPAFFFWELHMPRSRALLSPSP